MLRTLSPTEQHGVALGFIMKEQREVAARATVSTPSTPRVESLKLHVTATLEERASLSSVGLSKSTLPSRLVEVDTAITARRIVDPLSKVAFAMSCLGGRARRWAYGRRLTDPTYLSTYEVFKEELRQAFEPPQNEFRSRAEFLDLQQGKHDVHAYAQRARYLVSNIVTNPIGSTQCVTPVMSAHDKRHAHVGSKLRASSSSHLPTPAMRPLLARAHLLSLASVAAPRRSALYHQPPSSQCLLGASSAGRAPRNA
ncbi:unnamed protein product [Phytophthora fragariaefolia]|uniref:Unnamed protein product n=1 Tax=Phytophthora fragariaefolia TaxID=1490495 RepID=A0A9W6YNQ2_9STRA|nr:unnamed protein product [Phytophthora fragariaefolia]